MDTTRLRIIVTNGGFISPTEWTALIRSNELVSLLTAGFSESILRKIFTLAKKEGINFKEVAAKAIISMTSEGVSKYTIISNLLDILDFSMYQSLRHDIAKNICSIDSDMEIIPISKKISLVKKLGYSEKAIALKILKNMISRYNISENNVVFRYNMPKLVEYINLFDVKEEIEDASIIKNVSIYFKKHSEGKAAC